MMDVPHSPGMSTPQPGPSTSLMGIVIQDNRSLIEQQLCQDNIVFVPWLRGQPLPSKCKQLIINVYYKLTMQRPDLPDEQIVQQTADLLGVSARTIRSIKHELRTTGKLVTPGKERPKARGVRKRGKYDELTLSKVRQKIHTFLQNEETPTVRKITKAINDDEDLPTFHERTVHRLVQDVRATVECVYGDESDDASAAELLQQIIMDSSHDEATEETTNEDPTNDLSLP